MPGFFDKGAWLVLSADEVPEPATLATVVREAAARFSARCFVVASPETAENLAGEPGFVRLRELRTCLLVVESSRDAFGAAVCLAARGAKLLSNRARASQCVAFRIEAGGRVLFAGEAAGGLGQVMDEGASTAALVRRSKEELANDLEALEHQTVPGHPMTTFDEGRFVRALAGCVSLSYLEKSRLFWAIPEMTQAQIEGLLEIWSEEAMKFAELERRHEEQVQALTSKHRGRPAEDTNAVDANKP